MINKIESKKAETIEAIMSKPIKDFTENDLDILMVEWPRIKDKITSQRKFNAVNAF